LKTRDHHFSFPIIIFFGGCVALADMVFTFLVLVPFTHHINFEGLFICLMVLNATFNNISVISRRSILLVEETGGSGENHRPVESQVITKLPNPEQSYKGKVKSHNYINRQNQSTTGKL
jgi:hypothetical protein